MNIKCKDSLRKEQITCLVLLVISIVAFVLSIFFEFFLHFFLKEEKIQILHVDFIKNVLLGLSGSAIISYISIIFPFLNKIEEQLKLFNVLLGELYNLYLGIFTKIYFRSKNIVGWDTGKDNYSVEVELINKSDELVKKIKNFEEVYCRSTVSSKNIDRFIELYFEKIKINAYILKESMPLLLPVESKNSTLEKTSHIKKSNLSKRIEKDCYQLILDKLNENIDFPEFRRKLSSMKVNLTKAILKELIEDSNENIETEFQKMNQSFMVIDGLGKIRVKCFKEYNDEHDVKQKEFIKLMEKAKEKDNVKIKKIKQKFYQALQEDKMSKAEEIIRQLKFILS